MSTQPWVASTGTSEPVMIDTTCSPSKTSKYSTNEIFVDKTINKEKNKAAYGVFYRENNPLNTSGKVSGNNSNQE